MTTAANKSDKFLNPTVYPMGNDLVSLATVLASLDRVGVHPQVITAAGAINMDCNLIVIQNATPATAIAITMAVPEQGKIMVITQQNGATASGAATVSMATGSFTSTASQLALEFNSEGETVLIVGATTTRAYFASIGENAVTPA